MTRNDAGHHRFDPDRSPDGSVSENLGARCVVPKGDPRSSERRPLVARRILVAVDLIWSRLWPIALFAVAVAAAACGKGNGGGPGY